MLLQPASFQPLRNEPSRIEPVANRTDRRNQESQRGDEKHALVLSLTTLLFLKRLSWVFSWHLPLEKRWISIARRDTMGDARCQLLLTFSIYIFAENKGFNGKSAKITSYVVDSNLIYVVVSLWHNTLLLLGFAVFIGKSVLTKSKQLISTTTRFLSSG